MNKKNKLILLISLLFLLCIYISSNTYAIYKETKTKSLKISISHPTPTVTFDYNDGITSNTSKTVTYGLSYGELPSPTRVGYNFLGWNTKNDGTGSTITSSTNVTASENHTIYAIWAANNYTITLNANGGSIPSTSGWSGTGNTSTKSVTYDSNYGFLPNPTRTGYTFQGWTNNLFDENDVVTGHYLYIDGSIKDQNDWAYSNYIEIEPSKTYTFNPNSTKGNSAFHCVYDANHNFIQSYNSGLNTITMPSNAKYIRVSYRTSDSSNMKLEEGPSATSYYMTSSTVVKTSKNHTARAVWTANNYMVTANANGGSIPSTSGWSGTGNTSTKSVTYDKTYGTLPTPTKTGYTFNGWSSGTPVVGRTLQAWVSPLADSSFVTSNLSPNTSYKVEYDIALNEAIPSGYSASQTSQWGNLGFRTGTSSYSYTMVSGGTLYDKSGSNYTVGKKYHVTGTITTPSSLSNTILVFYTARSTNSSSQGYVINGTFSNIVFYPSSENYGPVSNSTVVKKTSNHTIYANWTANKITFNNKTVTSTYSSSSNQTISNGIDLPTNGTGTYTYAITGGNSNNYFSLTGRNIIVAKNTPANSTTGYSITITATDSGSGETKSAIYTIKVNKAVINIPSMPTVKTYSGSLQSSGITTPAGTTIVSQPELITNGKGTYSNNTNFSNWTYDSSSYNGSTGSFKNSAQTTELSTDDFFSLSQLETNTFSFSAKSANGSSKYYSMITLFDIDKKAMSASTYMFINGTTTTLSQDLKNGDTVVHFTNLSGWRSDLTPNHQRGFIFWNYTNSQGYTYPPETYSRNYYHNIYENSSSVNVSAGTITLKSAWTGGTIPAGTPVSQSNSGGTYKYGPLANTTLTTSWKNYSSTLTGVDFSGTNASKFAPFAVYAKVGFLWNREGSGDTGYITNVSVIGKSVSSGTNVGTYAITYEINDKNNYEWSDGTTTNKTIPWVIHPLDVSSTASVTSISAQTYNGSVITPNPTIKVGSTTLTKDTDYSLTYKNNIEPGTATVYIIFKGNYSGSKSVTFTINKITATNSISISGTNTWGNTLTATLTTNSDGAKGYQWYYSNTAGATSGGTAISGATNSTYTISSSYVGKYIYVVGTVGNSSHYTTPSNSVDATDASANTTQAVAKKKPTVTTSVSGTAQWGQTLTCSATNTGNGTNYTYQWYYSSSSGATSGTNINNATSSTYTISSDYIGKYIGCTATVASTTTYESASKGTAQTTAVAKKTCPAPTNVSIATDTKVSWTNASGASSYQISMSSSSGFASHTNGAAYSSITAATGSRTVYVRSVCDTNLYSSANSSNASKATTVYSLTLSKGTGISAVSNGGTSTTSAVNYITGKSVAINATVSPGHSWKNWTGSSTIATQSTSVTVDSNKTYTANATANTYKLIRIDGGENLLVNGGFENYSLINAQTFGSNSHTWEKNLNGVPGNTTKAYLPASWSTGLNSGVAVPEIGYHAHMRVVSDNAVFRYKTNESYNGNTGSGVSGGTQTAGTITTDRWLGTAQSITGTKLTAGKKYAISMDVYRVSGTTYINTGLYHKVSSSSSYGFHSGRGNLTPTTTGKWERLTYIFTLNSSYVNSANPSVYIYGMYGGSGELYVDNVTLEEVAEYDKTYGSNYSSVDMSTPSRTGYTLSGWYNTGTYSTKLSTSNTFTSSTAVFDNINTSGTNAYIYGKWTPNTYTITYNGNGNTSGSTSSSSHSYNVPKALTTNGFVRKDYIFNGWNTSPNGSGTSYSNGQSVVNLATSGNVTLYAQWRKATCTRATKLNTETCLGNTNWCVPEVGYGNTITYGNATVTQGVLKTGDAFDCDVNGNGKYDTDSSGNSTERFYYVSDLWNMPINGSNTYNTNVAVLIFYTNFVSGSPSNNGAQYHSNGTNYSGPITAISNLPTTSTWSNVRLTSTTRQIYTKSNATSITGGTLPSVSYSGKAARLLTYQELNKGCYNGSTSIESDRGLESCNFLFDHTKYSQFDVPTYGPWLETPSSGNTTLIFVASSAKANVDTFMADATTVGVRPVIEVSKSDIYY